MYNILPTDDEWAREAFLLIDNDPRQTRLYDDVEGEQDIYDITEKNNIMASRPRYDEYDLKLKSHRSNYYKYNDTWLGGMPEINIVPQASRFADPRLPRVTDVENPNLSEVINGIMRKSLGEWYSENIDDLGVRLHIRYGIPSYQSLWGFFSNFYSSDQSRYVRLGRSGGFGEFIGRAIGWAFALRLWPVVLTGTAIKFFAFNSSTKFTTLKPMMATYWKYVSDVVNNIAVNKEMVASAGNVGNNSAFLGLVEATNGSPKDYKGSTVPLLAEIHRSLEATGKANFDMNRNVDGEWGQYEINVYNAFLPDIFKSRGEKEQVLSGINIFAVATRFQRKHHAWRKRMIDIMDRGVPAVSTDIDPSGGIITALETYINGPDYRRMLDDAEKNPVIQSSSDPNNGQEMVAQDAVNRYVNSPWGTTTPNKDSAGHVHQNSILEDAGYNSPANLGIYNAAYGDDGYSDSGVGGTISEWIDSANKQTAEGDGQPAAETTPPAERGLLDTMSETVNDLFEWWNDRVGQYISAETSEGSQWVTFRISGKDSVTETFSTSTRPSDLATQINSFSAGWRNKRMSIAGGILGTEIGKAITGFIGDIASGVLDSLQISGIGAFAGSAFADIPEHVDETQAQFNQLSVTIPLRAPSGTDLATFQSEIIPTIMMLVGAAPRSTGSQSYSGPFLCEWYCQGRGQSRLAVISSLTITRGSSEFGWTPNGKYRGIDLQVTFKDLSSVMHMPLTEKVGWKAIDPTKWSRLLFPQDSTFNDYTGVLSCLSLSQQVYKSDKFKRNWNQVVSSFEKWFDPAARVQSAFDGNLGTILTLFGKSARR